MTAPLEQVTEANRASWNQIAPARHRLPAEFFRAGGLALEDFELALAGDVRGQRVLQLACSCGDQVLSWSTLGATATGVDISDVAITIAQQKAADAGILADFPRADMYDLPPDLVDLVDLDLIYFSWGAICWAPDLNRLAGILSSRLRPGGSVLLADHHPIWEVLAVRGDDHLVVTGNYFGRATPRPETDNAKLPTGARDTSTPPSFKAFVWPTSDVVMAFLNAGLRLDSFTESPSPDIYWPRPNRHPAPRLLRHQSHQILTLTPMFHMKHSGRYVSKYLCRQIETSVYGLPARTRLTAGTPRPQSLRRTATS